MESGGIQVNERKSRGPAAGLVYSFPSFCPQLLVGVVFVVEGVSWKKEILSMLKGIV